MDHNHSPHPSHAVKRVNAPQSVGGDAASGVAQDSGFCGRIRSVSQSLDMLSLTWPLRNREAEKDKPPCFSSKKASRSTRTSMQDTVSFASAVNV